MLRFSHILHVVYVLELWIMPLSLADFSVQIDSDLIRVSALHALAYCPRLFYLEEVEELYSENAAIFAGRRLHTELEKQEGEDWEDLFLESEDLGLRGRVDALRTRDGQIIPYEHKRGRAARDPDNQPQAWESDRLQILAYAYLMETVLGIPIPEGRIRYHGDNVLVRVPLDDAGRQAVRQAIEQARLLRQSHLRPPITDNERLCAGCSLAPVCLPEEARLAHDREWQPIRLFPEDDERQCVHILEPGARVGRSGFRLKVSYRNQNEEFISAQQTGQIVLHGFSQISTQAIYFCAEQGIGIHLISGGGRYVGSLDPRHGSIQRRIRQYQALSDPQMCLKLARKLVACRGQSQRKFLMRLGSARPPEVEQAIDQMRRVLKQVDRAESLSSLLGLEGNLSALYFAALPYVLSDKVPEEMRFSGRNRRPPKDRFNALLGFGYALLLKDVMNAILTVGLEPALGFYHQPRSQAPPLALDLMEIFRVPLVDMPIVASVNRKQWDPEADFIIRGQQVWLSEEGRKKMIQIYEDRKQEKWKHPVTNYSLTYRRLLELEVRLLEKEWNGEGDLFGNLVVR
ncbi:type I-MYXAN CRISPR-associated endonuclease Cas1 [Synechococcus sp. H60.2]|uniref:type I-MYXAN CRISPR-associated endonuclease Cas1 n=1 Tax=unclassified Synechococcus TaxID=2626047 RepID=UPI0039C1C316